MIGGYNQRDTTTLQGHRWCCACYAGTSGTNDVEKAAVERSKVIGFHLCRGCRCFIHTAIYCEHVRSGEADGDYLCGHCFAVRDTSAPFPAGLDDVLPDDGDDSAEDVLATGKRHKPPGAGTQQQGEANARKRNRCKQCAQTGHNKRSCPQLRPSRAE